MKNKKNKKTWPSGVCLLEQNGSYSPPGKKLPRYLSRVCFPLFIWTDLFIALFFLKGGGQIYVPKYRTQLNQEGVGTRAIKDQSFYVYLFYSFIFLFNFFALQPLSHVGSKNVSCQESS